MAGRKGALDNRNLWQVFPKCILLELHGRLFQTAPRLDRARLTGFPYVLHEMLGRNSFATRSQLFGVDTAAYAAIL